MIDQLTQQLRGGAIDEHIGSQISSVGVLVFSGF